MLDHNYNMFNNDNAEGKPLETFILTVRHNITNLLFARFVTQLLFDTFLSVRAIFKSFK